ncbi:MAG: hypothetical protein IPM48_09815 [Saprospiraceae bacterium]|nr:hypothetical protein [Saprospiraceae bacterium]
MQDSEPSYYKYQPLLLALCTLIGMYGGYKMRLPEEKMKELDGSTYPSSQNTIYHLKDVFAYLDAHYLDSILYSETSDYLTYQLCLALDPFTEYIPSAESKNWHSDLNNSLHTLGLRCIEIDGKWWIQKVLDESDAAEKGLKAGFELHQVNGQSKLDFTKLDSIAENTSGGELSLQYSVYGETNKKTANLQLRSVPNPSVTHSFGKPDQYFYIRLEKINSGSYREFMNTIENYVSDQKISNMILDLRGNGGGLLNEAADILNQLVRQRDVVLFTTFHKNGRSKSYKSTGKPFFQLEKIVILSDHQTASSAEVIAGVLQELKLAKVVGQETRGKATVLESFQLAGGAQLLIPTARIYLPSGRCFQKNYASFTGHPTDWLSTRTTEEQPDSFSSFAIVPDFIIGKSWTYEEDEDKTQIRSELEEIMIKKLAATHQKDLQNLNLVADVLKDYKNKIGTDLFSKQDAKISLEGLATQMLHEKTMGEKFALGERLKTDPAFQKAVEIILK